MTELADLLRRGAAQLEIALTAEQEEKLLAYVALLHKWNKAYNLTAIREPRDMVVRHLLDSLAVLPWLSEAETLDVGTGAGVPGIVLAVMRTEQNFVLLDSNGKKNTICAPSSIGIRVAKCHCGAKPC